MVSNLEISNKEDTGRSPAPDWVHGKGLGAELPGRGNKHWADFIKAYPNASPSEIFHYAVGLLKRYGLANLPYVPYR